MSKIIKFSPKNKADLLKEFEAYLSSDIRDGKVNFSKSINSDIPKTTLTFSEAAWLKMNALVQAFSQEIGWHGIARRTENGYAIDDILIYPQQVTSVTVTTDQKEYEMWLMCQDDEVFNNIRMQGHSHVNMGVTPSAVDTTHQEKIINQMTDDMFYIFIIINKRGDKFIKIHDIERNTVFETSDIVVEIEQDTNGVMALVDEAKTVVAEYKYSGYSNNGGNFGAYSNEFNGSYYGGYQTGYSSQTTTNKNEKNNTKKSNKGKRKR